MIVQRETASVKPGKIEALMELYKAQTTPEITQRAYTPITGPKPQLIWEGEFENEEERVKWWQSWVTPDYMEKVSEYVDHWETQLLTLLE